MEMKPILNIMVDLETASTKENAAILSWAMVPFFSDGNECGESEFNMAVSLTSCFLAGMDFDKGTQQWWLQQDPKARGAILHAEEEVSIHTATVNAYAWLENLAEKYDLYIWSRGLDFDIPKMEWCFRKFVERPLPYKYSHKMDVRTVLKFMQIDQNQFEFKGVKHNALDDCLHDIEMIRKAYELKDKWMMSEVVVSAGKTANKIKAERAEKEDRKTDRGPIPKESKAETSPVKTELEYLPELSALLCSPCYAPGKERYLLLTHSDVVKLERSIACIVALNGAYTDELDALKEDKISLMESLHSLSQQFKDFLIKPNP